MSDPNNIPEKYGISDLNEYVKKAIESYNKGDIIEAFVLLYSILEMGLNMIWNIFVFSVVKKSIRPAPKKKEYSDLVDLLYEFDLLNENQCSILRDFKKGRNEAVHHLASHMSKKVGFSKLDDRFKKGIKADKILDETLLKIAKKSFPKNLLSKK